MEDVRHKEMLEAEQSDIGTVARYRKRDRRVELSNLRQELKNVPLGRKQTDLSLRPWKDRRIQAPENYKGAEIVCEELRKRLSLEELAACFLLLAPQHPSNKNTFPVLQET